MIFLELFQQFSAEKKYVYANTFISRDEQNTKILITGSNFAIFLIDLRKSTC